MNGTSEIVDRLTAEIAARARMLPEQVGPDAHFIVDMGMSSLDVLCVLAFAEKDFAVSIPDEVLGDLTSLNKLADAVCHYQEQASRQ